MLGFFLMVTSVRSSLSIFAAMMKSLRCNPFNARVNSSTLTPGPSMNDSTVCPSHSAMVVSRVTTSAALSLSPPVLHSRRSTSCPSTTRIFQSITCLAYTSFCTSSTKTSPSTSAAQSRLASAVNSATPRGTCTMCSVSASPRDLELNCDSISPAVASRAPKSPPRPARSSSLREAPPSPFIITTRERLVRRQAAAFLGTLEPPAAVREAAATRFDARTPCDAGAATTACVAVDKANIVSLPGHFLYRRSSLWRT
mmetsp:Transcript_2067/g.4793  ORF Transcript_2067/g.4793 Transcript_2067/m.4793 type:complete len:255 (+) Transcript_2067:491-1255(+)